MICFRTVETYYAYERTAGPVAAASFRLREDAVYAVQDIRGATRLGENFILPRRMTVSEVVRRRTNPQIGNTVTALS